MRWAWQQDFHQRPSAFQLEELLASPSVPLMVDAYNLQAYCDSTITCCCTVTLPIDISTSSESTSSLSSIVKHLYVTQGDIQEEVWLCAIDVPDDTGIPESRLSVISFKGRANFSVDVRQFCLSVHPSSLSVCHHVHVYTCKDVFNTVVQV